MPTSVFWKTVSGTLWGMSCQSPKRDGMEPSHVHPAWSPVSAGPEKADEANESRKKEKRAKEEPRQSFPAGQGSSLSILTGSCRGLSLAAEHRRPKITACSRHHIKFDPFIAGSKRLREDPNHFSGRFSDVPRVPRSTFQCHCQLSRRALLPAFSTLFCVPKPLGACTEAHYQSCPSPAQRMSFNKDVTQDSGMYAFQMSFLQSPMLASTGHVACA